VRRFEASDSPANRFCHRDAVPLGVVGQPTLIVIRYGNDCSVTRHLVRPPLRDDDILYLYHRVLIDLGEKQGQGGWDQAFDEKCC
jgi:hypothetical protein